MVLFRQNSVWIMRFEVNGVKVFESTGMKNKRRAMAVERRAKKYAETRKYIISERPWSLKDKTEITFQEAIERAYLEHWHSKVYGKDSRSKLYMALHFWGNMNLNEINEEHLSRFYLHLEGLGRSDSTISRYKACFRKLFRMAKLEWKSLNQMPYIRISKPKYHRTRVVSRSEEIRLLKTLREEMGKNPYSYGPHVADLCEVLVDTGMRVGEVLKIEFDEHVDMNYGTGFPVVKLFPGMTKSGKPRIVPLSDRAAQVLQRRSKTFPDRLFPYGSNAMAKTFRKARKRMQLNHDRDFVLHALRHTCASRMVLSGVSIYDVKEMLGHSSITVTERYAHLNVDKLKAAVDLVQKEYMVGKKSQTATDI